MTIARERDEGADDMRTLAIKTSQPRMRPAPLTSPAI